MIIIINFLSEYKNKFSINQYAERDLETNIDYKQDKDRLKSKISIDFLLSLDKKEDETESWMEKTHGQLYKNIDISSLSFFVKKKAKDIIEIESFQHMFINEEIKFMSDFIYIDEIDYEELNYPVLFTIGNFTGSDKYRTVTNFFYK